MFFDKRRNKAVIRADNLALANRKNAVGNSHLNSELNRINREQVVEMRMHNIARQRFRNKYPRWDVFEESEATSDYAAYNPCYCSGSNEESPQRSYIKSSSVNMQDLHALLFTDGEIDIDKVLCLYLLTAHKAETLRMPPRSQRVGYKARHLSPLERLIVRAKKRKPRSRVFRNLPLFLLDVPILPPKKARKVDPRLEDKVIVNTKIMRIIQSVKTALEACNPGLLKRFMYLAHDRSRIENTMMQPKMDAFYKTLHGQNIISCCESFELEIVPKNGSLSFRIDVEPLEELIRLIRKNVLLVPNSRAWREPTCSPNCPSRPAVETKNSDEKTVAGPSGSEACPSSYLEDDSELSDDLSDDGPSGLTPSTLNKLSKSDQEFFLNIEQYTDAEIDKRETMFKMQPKIMKNLQLGFSNMDLGEEEHQYTFDQDLPLAELAILLDQKVREEASVDYQNFVENLLPERTESEYTYEEVEVVRKPPVDPRGPFRVRQTTCIACLKRWTEPLPTPKISNIRKMKMPGLDECSYFSSKSAQRISDLIDQKVKKLQLEEELAASCNHTEVVSHRQMQRMARGSRVDQTIEIIDLDEMDLARIRQEIRECETAKKLKKFFES